MKIDLHVHTSDRSDCGQASQEEQIRAAIAAGLDGLMFTDHHRLVPPAVLARLNKRFAPFRIFSGIEITVVEKEDILVTGFSDKRLESRDWHYPALQEFVRSRGGFLCLAHPFRYHPEINIDLAGYPPDALEIYSWNIIRENSGRIRKTAEKLNIPVVCNSDSHSSERIGLFYNILHRVPTDEKELAEILRQGAFHTIIPDSGLLDKKDSP